MIVLAILLLLFAAVLLQDDIRALFRMREQKQIPDAKIWSKAKDWDDVMAYEAHT